MPVDRTHHVICPTPGCHGRLHRESYGPNRTKWYCLDCDHEHIDPPLDISEPKTIDLRAITPTRSPHRPRCMVSGCSRLTAEGGLCEAHWAQYCIAGKPEDRRAWALEIGDTEFAAARTPKAAQPTGPCRVPGCDREGRAHGLCHMHHQRWLRAGSPPLEAWIAAGAITVAAARKETSPMPKRRCKVAGCQREPVARGLCRADYNRWVRDGRPPDMDAWARTVKPKRRGKRAGVTTDPKTPRPSPTVIGQQAGQSERAVTRRATTAADRLEISIKIPAGFRGSFVRSMVGQAASLIRDSDAGDNEALSEQIILEVARG